jgi:iron complex outermembrane receptor protein
MFGKTGTEDIAGSAMIDWAITENLSWTNSARIDAFTPRSSVTNFSHDYQPVSYNSGLVWKATSDDTLRLTAGRSVQTPGLIALVIFGDGFKPSTLDNVELSWDHNLADISSKFHVAVYQEWYSKLMGLGAVNMGSSKSTGVDASLEGAADGWRWNLSLNARSVSDDIATLPPGVQQYQLDFAHTTPKWVGNFGIGKSWGDFEFDLVGKWQSSFKDWSPLGATMVNGVIIADAKVSAPVPAYLTMTARVGWKITDQLMLSVTASQFNKKNVYEGAGVPDKARYLASLTASL